MRKSLITLMSVVALVPTISLADFQSDTTPVDMRNYWPVSSYMVQTYRNPDGVLSFKRITKDNDPMNFWLPPPQSGEVRFGREDWYPSYYGSEIAYFHSTWGMSKRADMSVWEQSDSWPASPTCTDWCGGPGQYYINNGIVQGKPGGHTLGESHYSNYGVTPYMTPNLQTTAPSYSSSPIIHSVVRMVAKHNSFTPWYGRNGGVWGAGNGKTYLNVVQMEFSHGVGPDIACSNLPAGYLHQQGYKTFWQYIWYAEGVGEIQRLHLFDEGFCDGFEISGIGWSDYIEEDH